MAIITWDDDGSQYYVPDALLYGNDPKPPGRPQCRWRSIN